VDNELRPTFRRTFSSRMMQYWGDLLEVVGQVVLNEDSMLCIGIMKIQECIHLTSVMQ
jgi:hypothetical protein